jgi:hypothetical protein
MHPLDSSLDASLHANSNNNHNNHSKARVKRRSSLDNGCFATNESILLLTMSAAEYYASNDIQMKSISRRRLSLNNCMTMPTTFLSNYNCANPFVLSSKKKNSELDADCHDELQNNISRHSLTCSTHTQNQRRMTMTSLDGGGSKMMNNNARSTTSAEWSMDDSLDSDSDYDDCDSFCEAAGQEPANKCFIEQMGVSCMFKEDAFFMAAIELGDPHEAAADPPAVASAGSTRCENDDDDDNRKCHHLEDYNMSDHPDYDDEHSCSSQDSNDDCDSFCDATEKEPANAHYLRKDLGASCFWGSNDLEDAFGNMELEEEEEDAPAYNATTSTGTPHTLLVGIGTITEEA